MIHRTFTLLILSLLFSATAQANWAQRSVDRWYPGSNAVFQWPEVDVSEIVSIGSEAGIPSTPQDADSFSLEAPSIELLRALSKARKVRRLRLHIDANLDSEGDYSKYLLIWLKQQDDIRYLDVEWPRNFTSEETQAFSQCASLKSLYIKFPKDAEALSGQQIRTLFTFASPKRIGLSHLSVDGAKALAATKSVTSFDASSLESSTPIEAMQALKDWRSLEVLHLTKPKLSTRQCATLVRHCPADVYNFRGTPVNEVITEAMSEKYGLTALDFAFTGVSDAAFAKLPKSANLHWLALDSRNLTDATVGRLADYPSLRTLARLPAVGAKGLEAVSKLKSLASLDLRVMASASNLELLGNLKALTKLTLIGQEHQTNSAAFAAIARIESLRSLWISNISFNDEAFQNIRHTTSLRKLAIEGNALLSGEGFQAFSFNPGIREFSLLRCPSVSRGLSFISSLSRLSELQIVGCPQVKDESIASFIDSCESLRELDLSNCPLLGEKAMSRIVKLAKLEVLRIDGWQNPIPTINRMRKHPNLRELYARRANCIDAEVLKVVASMRKIEKVDLADCPSLTSEMIGELVASPTLRELDISGTSGLKKAEIEKFAENARLATLKLSGIEQMTDEDLKALGKLNSLQRLVLMKTKNASADILAYLRRELPGCFIADKEE